MKPYFKKLLRGSAISLIGAVSFALLNYLVRRIMANGLPLEAYGFFYAAMAICSLCLSLTEFGTKSAGTIMMTKYLASGRKRHADATLTVVLGFNLTVSLLMALGLAVATPWLMRDFFHYEAGTLVFMILLVYMVICGVDPVMRSGLNTLQEYFYFNLVNIIRGILLVVGVWLLLPMYQITGAAMVFLIAAGAAGWLAYKLLKKRIEIVPRLALSRQTIKNIFKMCSWMTLSGTGMSIIYSADTVCLTKLGSLNDVALYHIALPLMQMGMSLVVLPMVFMPMAAEMWQLRNYRQIKRYMLMMNGGLMLALPVVAVIGYYVAPWVITIFFGKQFVAASIALVWLWIGMIFYAMAQCNMTALDTGNMQKASALIVIAGVAINVILNILLIPKFGLNGAAAATAAAYLFIASASALKLESRLRNAVS